MKLSKKGFTLLEVPSLMAVLVVIAIVLGMGATVLSNLRDTDTMSSTSTAFVSNATFTALNSTAVNFATAYTYDGEGKAHLVTGSCTGVKIALGTADQTANFTISGCTATLKNNNQNNTKHKANFTYTYNTYEESYNITTQGLEGQSAFSGWQGTFVIILAAAVIIGVIGQYLFFKG